MLKKILLLLVFALCSCTNNTEQFIHFTPPPNTRMNIEFDYPTNWTWKFGDGAGTVMTLYEKDNSSSDRARVVIYSLKHQTNSIFERLVSIISFSESMISNSDSYRWLSISNAPSLWIVYNNELLDPNLPLSGRFRFEQIQIFLRNGSYSIILAIPKAERESSFGRGFDRLISTIKITE